MSTNLELNIQNNVNQNIEYFAGSTIFAYLFGEVPEG